MRSRGCVAITGNKIKDILAIVYVIQVVNMYEVLHKRKKQSILVELFQNGNIVRIQKEIDASVCIHVLSAKVIRSQKVLSIILRLIDNSTGEVIIRDVKVVDNVDQIKLSGYVKD